MKTWPEKIHQTTLRCWIREDLVLNGRGKRSGDPFQVTQKELNASEPPMRCREIHTDLKTSGTLEPGGQGQGLPNWTWLPFSDPAYRWQDFLRGFRTERVIPWTR